MTEAFGFSFVPKRAQFGLKYDMMYTTYMYQMPTRVKKESIFANNVSKSLMTLAQLGVIRDKEYEGVWLHGL